MSQAEKIVASLLEDYNPYDIDDPLEQPEYHGGFIATSPEGARIEVRLVALKQGRHAYHWVRHGWSESENKPVSLSMGYQSAIQAQNSEAYIKREAKKYADSGWQVEFL